MEHKYIQPVSMQVTKEQYEKDLREPLLRMGYKDFYEKEWENIPVLVTNYANTRGKVSNTSKLHKESYNRHFIPDYNPEYFLAVAAMTSETFGIVGEWWKYVNKSDIAFLFGKLYKCICKDHTDNMPLFEDRNGKFNGHQEIFHLKYFTKATLSDLINHFESKPIKNTNNMELTQQEKEVLAKLVNKDNEAIFEKIGVKRDKNPIKKLSTENETLTSILHYICVAFKSADEIDRKDLVGRSFTLNAQNTYKFILHEKDGFQVLEITEK